MNPNRIYSAMCKAASMKKAQDTNLLKKKATIQMLLEQCGFVKKAAGESSANEKAFTRPPTAGERLDDAIRRTEAGAAKFQNQPMKVYPPNIDWARDADRKAKSTQAPLPTPQEYTPKTTPYVQTPYFQKVKNIPGIKEEIEEHGTREGGPMLGEMQDFKGWTENPDKDKVKAKEMFDRIDQGLPQPYDRVSRTPYFDARFEAGARAWDDLVNRGNWGNFSPETKERGPYLNAAYGAGLFDSMMPEVVEDRSGKPLSPLHGNNYTQDDVDETRGFQAHQLMRDIAAPNTNAFIRGMDYLVNAGKKNQEMFEQKGRIPEDINEADDTYGPLPEGLTDEQMRRLLIFRQMMGNNGNARRFAGHA